MGKWQGSSLKMADNLQKGPAHAQKLCQWVQAYIEDCEDLPVNPYGRWNESVIDKDPILAQEIHTHIQGIGKSVKAVDLCQELESREGGSSPGESQITLGAWENTQKDQGGSNTKKW